MEDRNLLEVPQGASSSSHPSSTYAANKSGNSLSRISGSASFNESGINPVFDSKSIRTVDRLPSAKPSVSHSDRLWTQIDVLDDVKHMSDEVKSKGSFFSESFNQQLDSLKESQDKLVEVMARQRLDRTPKELERNVQNSSHPKPSFPMEDDPKSQVDILDDFFTDNADSSRYETERKQDFDEISSYVDHVKDALDDVAATMRNFHDSTDEF
ncbi:Piso0_002400 [Millerozyma farinosa CBS 7064]|uniref:Piso0_002400 protein n=1 Tax=Pichia sorbitophila (strain ATCC MYA-4447 / BCRC 22081 / CBS 7064 / NBRC 10061 / NRRL Y-12695) TaxID=559304 RepID=G8YCI3_PICSO|nr:Piso0_002400 [Millerozyma farinosa CBS 7064]